MNDETVVLMKKCKEAGFNLYPMYFLFKKRSKIVEEIPEEVLQAVCQEYLKRSGLVKQDFPYFLQVLKRKSEEYFANKNIREHQALKKEPLAIKNIFKMLAEQ